MQICQSLIGGKPVKSNLPIIDKRYPAKGEVNAHNETSSDAMINEAVSITSKHKKRLANNDELESDRQQNKDTKHKSQEKNE